MVGVARVPGVDTWALDTFRLAEGGFEHATVAVLTEALRAACIAGAAVAIVALLRSRGRSALTISIGYTVIFLVLASSSELLKEVFGRPHPNDPTDVSYPSTHVTMAVVASLIAVEGFRRVTSVRSTWLVAAAVIAITATAMTRVALAEHVVTDVVGTALGYTGLTILALRLLRLLSSTRDDTFTLSSLR